MYRIGHWFFIPGKGWFEGSTAAAGSGAAGCAIPILIIAVISFWLASFFRPTYEYSGEKENSNDWESNVTLEYQKWIGSDSIYGMIDYSEERRGMSGAYRRWEAKSNFRGTLIDGVMTIELKDRTRHYDIYPVDADYFPARDGIFPETITLREEDGSIYFNETMKVGEMKLDGGKETFSTFLNSYEW